MVIKMMKKYISSSWTGKVLKRIFWRPNLSKSEKSQKMLKSFELKST